MFLKKTFGPPRGSFGEKDSDFMPNAGLGLTPQKIYFRAKEKDFIMDFRQAAHM